MTTHKVLVWTSTFFALAAAPAFAQSAPHVASVDPKMLYANYGGIVELTLSGTGVIVPGESAATFPGDVKLLVRRNAQAFVDASKDIKDWTSGRLDIEFDSREFSLQLPGTLDLVVVVRGVRSNIFSVPIEPYPSVAPTIESIGPDTFAANLPLQHQYLFHITAKNMPDDSKVSINGEPLTFFADADFPAGALDAYVPEDLRSRAGQYPVVVTSRSGDSNTMVLKIRDARLATAPLPAKQRIAMSANARTLDAISTASPATTTASATPAPKRTPAPRLASALQRPASPAPQRHASPAPLRTTSPAPLRTASPAPPFVVPPAPPSTVPPVPLHTAPPVPTVAKNPFVGVTPVPSLAQRTLATLPGATVAPALKSPVPKASPIVASVAVQPVRLDPKISARYDGVAAILLPSLRGAVDSIVANEVAAMRAEPTDPDVIAINSLRTIRPNATPAQLKVLEGYVLSRALAGTSDTSDVPPSQVQMVRDNAIRALTTLAAIVKKTPDAQDTIVQNLK